jgi:hypothetical protein
VTLFRLASLLLAGGLIAWLIGRAVDRIEAPDGGWAAGAPWLVLILAVALGYAFAFHRLTRPPGR